tara:strand:+ start:32 stop:289 length:258 start_codon:yes stop_codon:yes gene_type:complete
MTDIIRNWIFGPSDFDKPDIKPKNKKVTEIVEEDELKTQDNSLTVSSSKPSEGVTKIKNNYVNDKISRHRERQLKKNLQDDKGSE